MYRLQSPHDEKAILDNGEIVKPVVTLRDEHGGVSHIIVDDHCYVLINGSDSRPFKMSCWWYREAVEALKSLSLPS